MRPRLPSIAETSISRSLTATRRSDSIRSKLGPINIAALSGSTTSSSTRRATTSTRRSDSTTLRVGLLGPQPCLGYKKVYSQALMTGSLAIWHDSQFDLAYRDRGLTWIAKKELDEALSDLNEAIRLDPARPRTIAPAAGPGWPRSPLTRPSMISMKPCARFSLCPSLLSTRRCLGGPQGLQQSPRRLRPGGPVGFRVAFVYSLDGVSWSSDKAPESALADFDEMIRLDSRCVFAYNGRGFARYQMKAYNEAIIDFDEAIRLDPRTLSRTTIAAWRIRQLDNDSAIDDFNEAIRLDPQKAFAYKGRAVAAYNTRRRLATTGMTIDRAIVNYTRRSDWIRGISSPTSVAVLLGQIRRNTTRPSPISANQSACFRVTNFSTTAPGVVRQKRI